MNNDRNGPPDDDAIARLLKGAGGRDQPDAAIEAQVRTAVESEWRQLVSARRRRQQVTVWAAAAGVAVAALAVWLAMPLLDREQPVAATLVQSSGVIEYRDGPRADWAPLGEGAALYSRQEVRTSASSRAAFELASGPELRIDRASHLVFDELEVASLEQGAAYVDSGTAPGAIASRFRLRTAAGTIRHLGTQYEARVDANRLRVAIREGSVRIETPGAAVSGIAGEQILVDGGNVTRSDLPAHDPAWDWIGAVTPTFDIEGRTLAEFLRWASRETGLDLLYVSDVAEREAVGTVLRGSIEGLRPDESIAAVVSTTGLVVDVRPDRIEVRSASARP
jgi:ferric-dicitrate binding protein FerR (iron transport regulator)